MYVRVYIIHDARVIAVPYDLADQDDGASSLSYDIMENAERQVLKEMFSHSQIIQNSEFLSILNSWSLKHIKRISQRMMHA